MSVLNGVYVDVNNTIYVRCGDSGTVTITGIPTDENYHVSLGVYNPLSKEIITETSANSNSQETITLDISVSMTETIGVGTYFYAIKLCHGSDEQTVLPKATIDSQGVLQRPLAPNFIVSPKLVEGSQE